MAQGAKLRRRNSKAVQKRQKRHAEAAKKMKVGKRRIAAKKKDQALLNYQMATRMLNRSIEDQMKAKVVQAGEAFSLRAFQATGKKALNAAKKKVLKKELRNTMRKNVGAAEKKLDGTSSSHK